MIKKIILLLIALFIGHQGLILAADGDTLWANTNINAPDYVEYRAVTTDSSGNSYVVGYLSDSVEYDFGNNVKITAGNTSYNNNAVLVKYNSSGVAQWAKTTTQGDDNTDFFGVSLDTSNNIYIVGYVSGTSPVSFGDGVTATGTNVDDSGLIVKYNSSGVAQWANVDSTSVSSRFFGVSTDSSGNSFVVGDIVSNVLHDFGNSVTVTPIYNGSNAIVVKYNTAGVAQWAKSPSNASGGSVFNGVSVNSAGTNVLVAGRINSNTPFDFGNSISVSGNYVAENTVVAKYDANGSAQWASSTTTATDASELSSIASNTNGDIFVGGYTNGITPINFGNSVSVSGGYSSSYNTLVLKYNASGVAQWAKSVATTTAASRIWALSSDTSGNVYAAGYLYPNGIFDFGNSISIPSSARGRGLVLKYNSSGVAQWAKSTTSAPNDTSEFFGLSLDTSGNAYVVGTIFDYTVPYVFGVGISISGGTSRNAKGAIIKYSGSPVATPTPASTPTTAPTSTPVPTTAPTAAPVQTSVSSSNAGNSTDNNLTPSCGDDKPSTIPDLFQINIKGNSAKLFFTPISNTNKFFISFSTSPNAEEHGELVTLLREGVQSHSVFYLQSNRTYYFKVRGQNGCQPGEWSNIMKVNIQGKDNSKTISFYKNTNLVKTVFRKLTSVLGSYQPKASTQIISPTPVAVKVVENEISVAPTKSPVVVPPKKSCFLWWCK